MTTSREQTKGQASDQTNEQDAAAGKEQQQQQQQQQQLLELVKSLYAHSLQALKTEFGDVVDGQVTQHEVYGPLFTFRVKNEQGESYACGFFLRELLAGFQQNKNPALWLSSFFVDLMKTPGGAALPKPPQSQEEAKALVDKTILPRCYAAIKEEFEPEQVYSGLDMHKEHGPVLEAGFPKYKDGNNVCAMPLHLLIAHHLLNRDPAELIVQGLYRILDEQEKKQPQA